MFSVLGYEGVRSAPVWDSAAQTFIGKTPREVNVHTYAITVLLHKLFEVLSFRDSF